MCRREGFLTNVCHNLARAKRPGEHRHYLPQFDRQPSASENCVALFQRQFMEAGGYCFAVADEAAAIEQICEIVRSHVFIPPVCLF